MPYKKIAMQPRKKIALVAHDNKKQDLFDWAKYNVQLLAQHDLYATGTTGTIPSPLMAGVYQRLVPDYTTYRARLVTATAAGTPATEE
ncbi:MAG TPA: hypothetical protein VJA16_03190 [Thermoanaerobaculia bacterium]